MHVQPARAERPLIMGVFPRRNVKQTYKGFTPMVRHLEAALGRRVRLEAMRKFTDFWEDVQARRFDIVHFNQYHYLISRKLYGYRAILKNEEFGEDAFASAIFAHVDSGYTELADLKGKTIMFGGGKRAMMSHIVPNWMLRNAGLGEGDYTSQIALNPPNAVISTYHGRADAAGAGERITRLNIVWKNIDVSKLQVLARSEKLSHLPWAVKEDMPRGLRARIRAVLTGLRDEPMGKAVLQSAQMTGFSLADDSDYESSEKIITELYGDGYAEADA